MNSSSSPNELVNDLFSGNCINTSNIDSPYNGTINGLNSYGVFNKGTSNFPFESGIVLSTGDISDISNTAATESMSAGSLSWATSNILEQVLNIEQTLNATSISFDVSTTSNTLTFNYIFASDEYQQEYACNFSDVFAILIKKANSTEPFTNIALIPGTDQVISTSTIRPQIDGVCSAENNSLFEGYGLGDSNFKGRTTPLSSSVSVDPNETYTVQFIIADDIDQRYDSAVFIETFSSNNSVDLGPDINACGNTVTLNADINNPSATYSWLKDGSTIANANSPSLQVTETGIYTVEVALTSGINPCLVSDSVFVEVVPFLEAPELDTIIICDDSLNDGTEIVNFESILPQISPLLSGEISDYTFSFFTSETNALNDLNPLPLDYQISTGAQQIFIRIESNDGSCLQVGNFFMELLPTPSANNLDLQVCNGQLYNDGSTTSNLATFSLRVANFQLGNTVSYFNTIDDANADVNEIFNSFEITENASSFFARVESNSSGCFQIANLSLTYSEEIDFGDELFYYNLCAPTDTGFHNFPLSNELLTELIAGSNSNYLAYMEPPIGFFGYNNTTPYKEVIDVIVRDTEDLSACPTIVQVELHTNLGYNLLGDQKIINVCDDDSNDGIESFNFNEIISSIKGPYDVNFSFYDTAEDRDNQENAIFPTGNITVNGRREIFVLVESIDCVFPSSIVFEVSPKLSLFPANINTCGDTDNNGNNIVFLENLIDAATQNIPNAHVEFYLSTTDLENNQNQLSESIDFSGSSILLYTKVFNTNTGCFTTSTLTVNIEERINLLEATTLEVCAVTDEGIALVNLEEIIPELSTNDLSNYNILYFTSEDDALNNQNNINRPDGFFTSSTQIFIRLEERDLGCTVFGSFEVLVIDQPQLASPISTFRNCQSSLNTTAEFIFNEKDEDIINNQAGLIASYFMNETDAINNTNAIDKNSPYTNISNPQQIFVRLENELSNSCFVTGSFFIEVNPAVSYNWPSDVIVCDINENGLLNINLNEKALEILDGQPNNQSVSFFSSQDDAENNINPLNANYTNSINPEPIYVRIENVEGCFEITSFIISIFELPETINGQSLNVCSSNLINQSWDLTDVELDILDGRQYNIGFEYYTNEADLAAGNNPISNPENYSNTLGIDTLYLKVINYTTNCYKAVPFTINILDTPYYKNIDSYQVCDNDTNSVTLNNIEELLVFSDATRPEIEFYSSLQNANQQINILQSEYIYSSASDVIYARLTHPETGCFLVEAITIDVIDAPYISQAPDISVCDDDLDGFYPFNFFNQASLIRGSLSEGEYTVTFYQSFSDAENITNELPYTYFGYNNETIYARLQQTSTGCYSITDFKLLVQRLPFIDIDTVYLCSNENEVLVDASTGFEDDIYFWSTGESSPTVSFNNVGSYWVEITTNQGCSNRLEFEILSAEVATLLSIETSKFSNPNTIEVIISGQGNYSFQLNNLPPQESPIFYNVPLGFQNITIMDNNGCSEIRERVLVLGAPKFFSPNNDGTNDLWHIPGIDQFQGSEIRIFDRFGKLIKTLDSNSAGWDGRYNGHLMPTNDYWFIATLKEDGTFHTTTGHFTLKR